MKKVAKKKVTKKVVKKKVTKKLVIPEVDSQDVMDFFHEDRVDEIASYMASFLMDLSREGKSKVAKTFIESVLSAKEEREEDFVECCRCETREHPDNMMDTDAGYLCECCEGDLR